MHCQQRTVCQARCCAIFLRLYSLARAFQSASSSADSGWVFAGLVVSSCGRHHKPQHLNSLPAGRSLYEGQATPPRCGRC